MTLHRNISLIKWFNFCTDFRLYAPVAIIYFSQVSGSYALGMSIFSITMISSALFEIPTGVFSDRIGRRKTMMLGAGSAVLYALCYAIGQSFWILAIGAVFEGLSRALYSGNNEALLYDSLAEAKQENHFDEYLGKTSSMFQAALAISAILGSIFFFWSFALIMWLSVIPQLVGFVISTFITEPRVHGERSGNMYDHLREAIHYFYSNKKLRLLNIASVIGYGVGEASYQFQAVFYNTLLPIWAVGVVKTLSNAGAFLGYHYSGTIIKRWSATWSLFVGETLSRIISFVGILFPTVLSPFLLSSTSIIYGVTTVAENSLLQKEFTTKQRATMASLNAFAGSIFFGIIAVALGLMADSLTPRNALLLFQFLLIPPLFLYWAIFKLKE